MFIFIGWLVVSSYGIDAGSALFEVVSAQGNAGISTGITNPEMPLGMEVMLFINMFVGRLEIIPLFASIGFLFSLKRKRI